MDGDGGGHDAGCRVKKQTLGRFGYGAAAIGFGVCGLIWPAFERWPLIGALGSVPHREVLPYLIAAVEILGGIAILVPRTVRLGAVALGAVYLTFCVLAFPSIVAHPLVYYGYGNFFEQLSFVAGATIVYACCGKTTRATTRLAWTGYYAFGLCVLSFALEQAFYISQTASAVPKWIAPGALFWAWLTTAAFALAAIGLLARLMPRLAARLTAAMIAAFGLLVWVPALVTGPHVLANWTESAETLGIAAVAWIVAEFLDP